MSRSQRLVGSLFILALAVLAIVLMMAPQALATDTQVVAQEEDAYQPPDLVSTSPPWLQPFEPIAALPLWGQAAVLSASAAALFFLVPTVIRWIGRALSRGRFDKEADL